MRKSLIAAAVIALAMPMRAEPGPIGTWLMEQPVTLWDWGWPRIVTMTLVGRPRISSSSHSA